MITGPGGGVVGVTRAADDGAFAVSVAPGTYDVRATATTPGIGGGCQVVPAEVTVAPGTSVTIAVSCDTGIR